ncbi:MAG: hypothetical protein ACTSQI_07020 [Candidatus Helarchaeota archaeon]
MSINETNQLLRKLSKTFDNLFLKRLAVESKIFPVSEYIMIACLNSYQKLYQQIELVNEKITPEQIGREQRRLFTEITPLQIFDLQMFPLFGRTLFFCQMGKDFKCESLEKFREIQFILDFWRRLAKTYFTTGALTIEEMGGIARILPEKDLQLIKKALFTPEKVELSKIKRTSAQLEVYCFMDECEARMKISEHGPYEIGNGEYLVVREMIRLYDGTGPQWPWSNTKATAPTSKIAFAFTLKEMNKIWFNDWGTMFTDPVDYFDKITGVALLIEEKGRIKSISVDELSEYEDFAQNALVELYREMTDWSRGKKIKAGALVYDKNVDRFTNLVGVTDQINWNLTEEIERGPFTDLVKKNGRSIYTPLSSWLFRGPKAKARNPTYYLRPEEEQS